MSFLKFSSIPLVTNCLPTECNFDIEATNIIDMTFRPEDMIFEEDDPLSTMKEAINNFEKDAKSTLQFGECKDCALARFCRT